MKLSTKTIAGAAAALSLVLAGAGYAQPGGGFGYGMMGPGYGYGMMSPGYGYGYGMMGPGFGPGMMGRGFGPGFMGPGAGMGWGGQDVAAAATGRAAELRALLKITPAQETAWKAYENAMVQQATTAQATHRQMHEQMFKQAPGSAEWIAQRDALLKQNDASWATYNAAQKDLYAALTPEQRAFLDRGPWGWPGPRGGRGLPAR